MYARNCLALVLDIIDKENNAAIKLDFEDEVVEKSLTFKRN